MKNNTFKVLSFIFIVLGGYSTLNLIYKIFAGQQAYIHNSDTVGPILLAIGIYLLVMYKRKIKAVLVEPKKTVFIWIILLYLCFSLLQAIDISDFVNLSSTFSSYFQVFLDILALGVTLIYIYKLNYLKKDILLWTNLYFGISVFILFYEGATGNLRDTTTLLYPPFLAALILGVVLWFFFYRHIVKAIKNKKIQLT